MRFNANVLWFMSNLFGSASEDYASELDKQAIIFSLKDPIFPNHDYQTVLINKNEMENHNINVLKDNGGNDLERHIRYMPEDMEIEDMYLFRKDCTFGHEKGSNAYYALLPTRLCNDPEKLLQKLLTKDYIRNTFEYHEWASELEILTKEWKFESLRKGRPVEVQPNIDWTKCQDENDGKFMSITELEPQTFRALESGEVVSIDDDTKPSKVLQVS